MDRILLLLLLLLLSAANSYLEIYRMQNTYRVKSQFVRDNQVDPSSFLRTCVPLYSQPPLFRHFGTISERKACAET